MQDLHLVFPLFYNVGAFPFCIKSIFQAVFVQWKKGSYFFIAIRSVQINRFYSPSPAFGFLTAMDVFLIFPLKDILNQLKCIYFCLHYFGDAYWRITMHYQYRMLVLILPSLQMHNLCTIYTSEWAFGRPTGWFCWLMPGCRNLLICGNSVYSWIFDIVLKAEPICKAETHAL